MSLSRDVGLADMVAGNQYGGRYLAYAAAT